MGTAREFGESQVVLVRNPVLQSPVGAPYVAKSTPVIFPTPQVSVASSCSAVWAHVPAACFGAQFQLPETLPRGVSIEADADDRLAQIEVLRGSTHTLGAS